MITVCIVEHGRTANLLSGQSKRKRKREELEEVKDEEIQLQHNRYDYLLDVKRFREENVLLNQELLIMSGHSLSTRKLKF